MTRKSRKAARQASKIARSMERALARAPRQLLAVGVNFEVVTHVTVLPGKVFIEGYLANGSYATETQLIPNSHQPPIGYYLTTGESPRNVKLHP